MKKTGLVYILAAFLLAGAADAAQKVMNEKPDKNVGKVTEAIKKINPSVPIDAVSETDMSGIYEVVSDGNIFYFHLKTNSIIIGEIVRNNKSLTSERRENFLALLVASVPLDKAIKIGSGKNVVVEFTDLDCPFCRRAHAFLNDRTDITRYVFLFPLPMHRDAPKKSLAVLCSADPAQAFREALGGKLDAEITLPEGCEAKANPILEEHMRWGKKLGVRGTPAFWVNGVGVSGADIDRIKALLEKGVGAAK